MNETARFYCPKCGTIRRHSLVETGLQCPKCQRIQLINSYTNKSTGETFMPTKKNPITDPDGSKRASRAKQDSTGEKARQLADSLGSTLQNAASTVSTVSNKVVETTAAINNAANNVRQALSPNQGYKHPYASSKLEHKADIYGGLSIPQVDFQGMVPSDLLNPTGLPECTEEQLTQGLAKYASATRAMELYKAGFQYIEKIGQTKQQFHKAQGSIIRAATEQIKVDREVVKFDIQNVELASDRVKLTGLKHYPID